jgi:hypothetical protein
MKNVSPKPRVFALQSFRNAPLGEQVFDVSMAEIEPMVEPDGMLNDRGRKSVSFVELG